MNRYRKILSLISFCLIVTMVLSGCGKKNDGLSPELIASYEHTFSNIVSNGEEDTLTYDEQGFVIADDYVYVRIETAILKDKPSDEGESVTTLTYGDKLYRTGYTEDWMRVYYENQTLYVSTPSVTVLTLDTTADFNYTVAALNIVETTRQFYTYHDMCIDLDEIRTQYSDNVSLDILGSTADNRTIYDVVIGNKQAENSILIIGGMEGCEYMTSLFAAKLAEYYAHYAEEGMYNGYFYSELLDNCAIHIIPMLNPDGVSLSQYYLEALNDKSFEENIKSWFNRDQSSGGINLSLDNYLMFYYANVRGTDVSKNFPYSWENVSTTLAAANKNYKGDYALSENESQDIVNLIDKINPNIVINLRTSGDSIMYRFGAEESVISASNIYANIISTVFSYSVDETDMGQLMAGSVEGYAQTVCGIPTMRINIGSGNAPLSLNEYNSIWNSGRESLAALIVSIINKEVK